MKSLCRDEKAGQPQFPFDKPRWQRVAKTSDTIRAMHKEQMLPAIFFIFSRVACDENASKLAGSDGVHLTSHAEQTLIQGEIDRLRSIPDLSPQVLCNFGRYCNN